MDRRAPGSSVHGIFQAGVLEWGALPSSWGSSPARARSGVACIACIDRQTFYHCSTWEDQECAVGATYLINIRAESSLPQLIFPIVKEI